MGIETGSQDCEPDAVTTRLNRSGTPVSSLDGISGQTSFDCQGARTPTSWSGVRRPAAVPSTPGVPIIIAVQYTFEKLPGSARPLHKDTGIVICVQYTLWS